MPKEFLAIGRCPIAARVFVNFVLPPSTDFPAEVSGIQQAGSTKLASPNVASAYSAFVRADLRGIMSLFDDHGAIEHRFLQKSNIKKKLL